MIAHLLLAAIIATSLPAVTAAGAGGTPTPVALMQQPTPQPEGGAAQPRFSLGAILALVCVFNLSIIALAGSIALKRRMNSIK